VQDSFTCRICNILYMRNAHCRIPGDAGRIRYVSRPAYSVASVLIRITLNAYCIFNVFNVLFMLRKPAIQHTHNMQHTTQELNLYSESTLNLWFPLRCTFVWHTLHVRCTHIKYILKYTKRTPNVHRAYIKRMCNVRETTGLTYFLNKDSLLELYVACCVYVEWRVYAT
jgi:hypothetical protein